MRLDFFLFSAKVRFHLVCSKGLEREDRQKRGGLGYREESGRSVHQIRRVSEWLLVKGYFRSTRLYSCVSRWRRQKWDANTAGVSSHIYISNDDDGHELNWEQKMFRLKNQSNMFHKTDCIINILCNCGLVSIKIFFKVDHQLKKSMTNTHNNNNNNNRLSQK